MCAKADDAKHLASLGDDAKHLSTHCAGDGFAELKESKNRSSSKEDDDDDGGTTAGSTALRSTIAKFSENWLDFSNTDMMELFEWETQHWHLFEPDEEEHSLQHTELHAAYSALFEAKLEAYITATEGISVEEFYQLVRAEMERAPFAQYILKNHTIWQKMKKSLV